MTYVPFIFIRHGSTDWAFDQLRLGVLDLSLNEKGRQEVRITARKLEPIYDYIIVSSPKKRTLETAALVSTEIGGVVQVESALNARYYGDFTQDFETCTEFQRVLCNVDTNDESLESLLPNDAEKKEPFNKRVIEAFERIMKNREFLGKMIIIVSHGEVYKSLCQSLNHQDDKINKGEVRFFYPPTALRNSWLISPVPIPK